MPQGDAGASHFCAAFWIHRKLPLHDGLLLCKVLDMKFGVNVVLTFVVGFALASLVWKHQPDAWSAMPIAGMTLLTVGLGALLGNTFAGRAVDWWTVNGVIDWRAVWLWPCREDAAMTHPMRSRSASPRANVRDPDCRSPRQHRTLPEA